MKVTPLNGPAILQPQGTKAEPVVSARERAIAKLLGEPAAGKPISPSQAPISQPRAPEGVTANTKGSPDPVADPAFAKLVSEHKSEQESASEDRQLHTDGTDSSPESTHEEPKVEAEAEQLSSQYAVMARKEKALRAREQQLRAREASIRAQEDASKAPQKPSFDESKYISKEKLAENPFAVLSEIGLSYDQLTEAALKAPKPEEIAQQQYLKKLESKIQELEKSMENSQKSYKEQQEQSYNQTISQMKQETKSLVSKDPAFEMISTTESIDDVVDLIQDTFQNGLGDEYPKGTLLTVEEAARIVEDYLTEEAFKLSKAKKIQQRLQPANAPVKAEALKQASQVKTLTNSMSSSKPTSARERAIAAFHGTLKN